MEFSNLDELRRHFGAESKDIEKLRKELRNRQATLHPDRTNGKFSDTSTERAYHEIDSAVSFLDGLASSDKTQLPARQMTDLVKSIRDLTLAQEDESRIAKLESKVEEGLESFRGLFRGTKITLAAVTAVLTGLWVFPNTILDHPILREYVALDNVFYSFFTALWLMALMFTGMLWLVAYIRDEREKLFRQQLRMETYQNSLFDAFLNLHRDEERSSSTKFSKDDFVLFLGNPENLATRKDVQPTHIDLDLAHRLSNLVVR